MEFDYMVQCPDCKLDMLDIRSLSSDPEKYKFMCPDCDNVAIFDKKLFDKMTKDATEKHRRSN